MLTPQWTSRDSFYRVLEGSQRVSEVSFSDGTSIAMRGSSAGCHWEASHDDGTGFSMCFSISGDDLTVHPECVRDACNAHGHLDSLHLAPYAWCVNGYPDKFFRVVRPDNGRFRQKPASLFESAVFYASDVLRAKDALSARTIDRAVLDSEKPLDERERTTLLCIIGTLAREARLDLSQPMKAGDAVAAMAPELRLSGRTIGEKLKQVREAMDRRTG